MLSLQLQEREGFDNTLDTFYSNCMNESAIKALQIILQKEVHELNDYDKAFLKARRFYLTEEQAEKYKDIVQVSEKVDGKYSTIPDGTDNHAGLKEFQSLVKQAKSLGIDTKGLKKEQLKDAILSKS